MALPWTVRERVDAVLRPGARVVGALGAASLLACAVLWTTSDERWPPGVRRHDLPVVAFGSLLAASLLGWSFLSDGQKRVRRGVGRPVAAALYLVLPIALAALSLVGPTRMGAIGGPGPEHVLWTALRWYGPVLVSLTLVAFLRWKSRGRTGRGLWFAALAAPYALLLLYFAMGVRLLPLSEPLERTLASMGAWALALQLALAYFVAD